MTGSRHSAAANERPTAAGGLPGAKNRRLAAVGGWRTAADGLYAAADGRKAAADRQSAAAADGRCNIYYWSMSWSSCCGDLPSLSISRCGTKHHFRPESVLISWLMQYSIQY